MNRYYNRLLKLLNAGNKQTLVTAQKAWLTYRDSESKLIGTLTKEEYSGGGTMQSLISTDLYARLIVKRTLDIFSYYDDVIKEK